LWNAQIAMPYTDKSLAFAWVIVSALFAMSASGAASGWRLLLLAAASLVPAIVFRTRADAAATSPERPLIVADGPEQSSVDLGGIDVLRWENEGGARRRPLPRRSPSAGVACEARVRPRPLVTTIDG
jgi:hypothetical protein